MSQIPFQVVIDSTTNQVKRAGYCPFADLDSFDPTTEEVIVHHFIFDPPLRDERNPVRWYWDPNNQEFYHS